MSEISAEAKEAAEKEIHQALACYMAPHRKGAEIGSAVQSALDAAAQQNESASQATLIPQEIVTLIGQATPTPWEYYFEQGDHLARNANGTVSARMRGSPNFDEKAERDFLLIVAAVNSVAQLAKQEAPKGGNTASVERVANQEIRKILRAILNRVKHRPAWFKNPAVSDKDWWVTQFTYEQMEGNRSAIAELCERALGVPLIPARETDRPVESGLQDTKRLDWLEANSRKVLESSDYWINGFREQTNNYRYTINRELIDSAMSATEPRDE